MVKGACLARFCASHPSPPTVLPGFTWTDVVMPLSLLERDPARVGLVGWLVAMRICQGAVSSTSSIPAISLTVLISS
jgi:hypothetical protein